MSREDRFLTRFQDTEDNKEEFKNTCVLFCHRNKHFHVFGYTDFNRHICDWDQEGLNFMCIYVDPSRKSTVLDCVYTKCKRYLERKRRQCPAINTQYNIKYPPAEQHF